jgi:hypothetical protein
LQVADKPLVSVVMSVFNGERFLRGAVESILNQTFRDFEFIIIDDGSTDATPYLLDRYAASDSRMRVFHQENRGLIQSLNRGCGLAQGKYIVRMDADDVAMPDRIVRQIDFLEKNPEVALLGGAIEGIDSRGRSLFVDRPALEDKKIRDGLYSNSFPLCHPAVVFRKEAFQAVQGYRSQFLHAEDIDLWLRILERWKAANLPDVVVRKRYHSDQVSGGKRRQQVVSVLGARAAALARRRDGIDPTCQVPLVSEKVLKELGVGADVLHQRLLSAYSYWIGIMLAARQHATALRLVNELNELSASEKTKRSTLSKAWLAAARTHYRQGRLFPALASLGRGVLARPVIVALPAKRALGRLARFAGMILRSPFSR